MNITKEKFHFCVDVPTRTFPDKKLYLYCQSGDHPIDALPGTKRYFFTLELPIENNFEQLPAKTVSTIRTELCPSP